MKTFFILFFLIAGEFCFSQSAKFIVKASDTNEFVKGALIYSNNQLIGESNAIGEVTINLKDIIEISIVKEDYEDLSILKREITGEIFLKKLESILLAEVVISKLTIDQILNQVEERLINHVGFYNHAKTFQYFNVLTVGRDTLHYLNNRMLFKRNDGFYLNNQKKIIKNFYFDNNFLVYRINDKKLTFYEDLNTRYPSVVNDDGLISVLRNRNQYNFDLISTENFYKISFKRNKIQSFSYQGYLIIDKNDFGIYELETKLVPHKGNISVTYLFTEKQNVSYLITESSAFYSLTKIDDEYIGYRSFYNFAATQIKGDFRGEKFLNKVKVETTPDFLDDKMYKFNLLTYEKF